MSDGCSDKLTSHTIKGRWHSSNEQKNSKFSGYLFSFKPGTTIKYNVKMKSI